MVAVAPPRRRQASGPDPHVLPTRIGAFILDMLAIAFLGSVLSRQIPVLHISTPHPHRLTGNLTVDYGLQDRSFLWGLGMSAVVFFLYFLLFEVTCGTTPGKVVGSLRIVDLQGRPASPPALLVRNVLRPVDALGTYWVGFLSAALSKRRQRVGDKAAGTMVVSARSVPGIPPPALLHVRTGLLALGALVLVLLAAGSLSYFIPPAVVLDGKAPVSTVSGGDLTVEAPGARQIQRVSVQHPQWASGQAAYRVGMLVVADGPARARACHITLYYAWGGLVGGWSERGFEEACLGSAASNLPGHRGGPPASG
jgi:uncharacterized RDD family membrane protein YckC